MQASSDLKTKMPLLTTDIHWSCVFSGMIIALVTGWLLNLLGLAVGLTTFATTNGMTPSFGPGSVIWLCLTSAISMFLGGWLAAQSAHTTHSSEAMLHGILAWALATVFSFIIALITAAGASNNLMGQGFSLAAGGTTRLTNETLAQIALTAFFMLLIGGAAAMIGGMMGRQKKSSETLRFNPVSS